MLFEWCVSLYNIATWGWWWWWWWWCRWRFWNDYQQRQVIY